MKKLFKKSIACLIAVLMVVSTMPFTAVTAQAATATEVANAKNGLTLATLQAAQPETFNAQAWFETSAAAGSNVIYCSQTLSQTGQTDRGYINWRFVFPSVAIMAYDGKNNVYSPAVVTTMKAGAGGALTNCKAEWVAVSDSQHAELRQEWKGYTDYKSGSHTWPGNATNEAFGYLTSGTENLSDSVSNTKTERAWGNLLYYNGNGSSDGSTYYDTVANLKFNVKSNAITGNTTDKTASFTNYYINYAPVRQILANEATHTVDGTVYNVQGLFSFIDANENKFTADSLVAYYNALKAVIGLNVKNSFSGVNDSNAATTVSTVANNIKKVVSNYNNAVAGLTRQYLVTFKYNNGDTASSAYYTLNQTPTAPTTNTESYYDETQHHTYSWPAVSIVTGDKTYNENKKSVNHSYTDEKLTDANCTENGSTKRTCACGYSYTDFTIPAAKGHTWREDAEVPAKCTETGVKAGKTCTECGVTEGYGEIPATGVHNYNVKVSDKQDATCTIPGKEAVYKCATCELTTGGETITAPGHNWGDWAYDETLGKEKRECSVCHETEPRECAYEETASTTATCTVKGSKTYTCKTCNHSYTTEGEVNPNNHVKTTHHDGQAATCTADGWTAYDVCDACKAEIGREKLSALGHTYGAWESNKDGTHSKYCERNCGEEDATVTEACSGMQDGVCDLCGYKTFDLISYNKAVDEYNAIKNDPDYTTKYTAKSRDDYKKAVEAAMKETFASQEEVDAATAAILSAKTKLVYANFDVKFVVVDENGFETVVETRNVNYGESVTFTKDVDNIAKWIVTTQNGKVETKVATSETSYTMIATEPATVSVYLSADKTEPVQYSKVSFISKNGAVAKVQYVKVGVTLNTATVDGIEIPFYNFAGWNKASVYADGSDIEVKALYTFIEEEAHKCNVHYEGFEGGVKQYSYDSFVYLFGAEDKTLALSTDGTEANIITYLNENAFYAPHTTDIYVIEVSTMNASIGITGSYASSTNDTKSATFNCKFFVPAGCTVVEYGLTAYSEKGAYKVKGETASARGEYCIKVTLDKTSPVNSMDGEAYLTYKTDDNRLVTIYSSRVTQNL